MYYGGIESASIVFASIALASCTHLQTRSMHEFEGVVINVVDGRPLAGATLVLSETRHSSVPWGTDYAQPIAHTSTDGEGRFAMRVCMTELRFRLEWSPGLPGVPGLDVPAPEYTRRGEREWFVKIYTQPRTYHRAFPIEAILEDEDPSFVDSC